MSKDVEISKLAELQKSLASRMYAAAHALSDAEQRLAHVLTLRAAGEPINGAEISVARMALSRALRNAEDLQRIQSVLPAMLEQARDARPAETSHAAEQAWTGERVALQAGD